MMRTRTLFWLVFAVAPTFLFRPASLAGSEAAIRGVVRDTEGKPVRAALVKVNAGIKTITRLTGNDGRYEIAVPPGSYKVTADAFGFAPRTQSRNAAAAGDTNFTLMRGIDVRRLSSADIESLLPDDKQANLIKGTCILCHSLGFIERHAGDTAPSWEARLPKMADRGPNMDPVFSPTVIPDLAQALEKYFGPGAPYFGPDAEPPDPSQIKHARISDAALGATIREYAVPDLEMTHSILADSQGIAWFSEIGAGKVGRFDPETETFKIITVPPASSMPHTGVQGKDGRIWYALFGGSPAPKLVAIDPETYQAKEYAFPEGARWGTHTLAVDPEGNIWSSGKQVLRFDPKSEKFQSYETPVPSSYPEDSAGGREVVAGKPQPVLGFLYDVKVDSKGIVWLGQFMTGSFIRLDPATGKTKVYKVPGVLSIRGLAVDGQDNVWVSNDQGHSLVELDQTTEKITQYYPPTHNAGVYGLVADKKTGDIWFSDFNGNNITRFSQKTQEFTEYPIPTQNAFPRYIGLDPRGRVWFTESWAGKIGVLDPGGAAGN